MTNTLETVLRYFTKPNQIPRGEVFTFGDSRFCPFSHIGIAIGGNSSQCARKAWKGNSVLKGRGVRYSISEAITSLPTTAMANTRNVRDMEDKGRSLPTNGK